MATHALSDPGSLTVVRDGVIAGAVSISGETPDSNKARGVEGIGAAGLACGEAAS